MQKFCVFTTLLGNYEALNEQKVAQTSEIDFICFTDDKNLRSDTWDIRIIDPLLPLDNVRSAKAIKINPHNFLNDYESSLYIDNSVRLKIKPEIIFRDLKPDEFDMVCFYHSYRKTLMDEYETVLKYDYDKPNIIFEQLNSYSIIAPELFNQKPYWGGFILRNHNQPSIIEAMDDWLIQIMRYSRRDQLSLNYVIQKYDLKFNALEIDNHNSDYHEWPTTIRYGTASLKQSLFSNIESNLRANAQEKELNRLSKQIKKQDQIINQLEQEVLYYSQSKSWKATKIFRNAFDLFRKKSDKPKV